MNVGVEKFRAGMLDVSGQKFPYWFVFDQQFGIPGSRGEWQNAQLSFAFYDPGRGPSASPAPVGSQAVPQ